jgi:hypothetical protein
MTKAPPYTPSDKCKKRSVKKPSGYILPDLRKHTQLVLQSLQVQLYPTFWLLYALKGLSAAEDLQCLFGENE